MRVTFTICQEQNWNWNISWALWAGGKPAESSDKMDVATQLPAQMENRGSSRRNWLTIKARSEFHIVEDWDKQVEI